MSPGPDLPQQKLPRQRIPKMVEGHPAKSNNLTGQKVGSCTTTAILNLEYPPRVAGQFHPAFQTAPCLSATRFSRAGPNAVWADHSTETSMRHIWTRSCSPISSFLRSPSGFLSRSYQPTSATAVFRTKRGIQTTAAGPPSAEEMETVNTTARLTALRSLMKDNGVDVYGTPPFLLPF